MFIYIFMHIYTYTECNRQALQGLEHIHELELDGNPLSSAPGYKHSVFSCAVTSFFYVFSSRKAQGVEASQAFQRDQLLICVP